MVNNFELLKNLLSFDNEYDFYHIEIIKRRKDNPDLGKNAKLIKTFSITSFEDYENLFLTIKKLCDDQNARAYIRVNKRNFEKLSILMIKRIAQYIENKNFILNLLEQYLINYQVNLILKLTKSGL